MLNIEFLNRSILQHSLPSPREAPSEARRDPRHGPAVEALAAETQTQPIPHEGGEDGAGSGVEHDHGAGESEP